MKQQFNIIRYPLAIEETVVRMHKKCEDELKTLVENSGKKSKFAAQFKNRIRFLIQNGASAIKHREWFEVLTNTGGIFAIRFIDIDNIRILYVLRNNNTAYLLHAFRETSRPTSKNANSYKHACSIAKDRIGDIPENNGENVEEG